MLLSDGAFRERVTFEDEETDAFGRVDARAVLRRFQTIAGHHFDALQQGMDTAAANGCFWATARTALDVTLPPPTGRALLLDTWPGRQAHGIFLRHYVLSDEDGREYLRGLSAWVLMDIDSRTLAANRDWVAHPGGISRAGELPAVQRFRIPAQLPETVRRTVRADETDANGHMNNAEYCRWGDELLKADFAAAHRLRRLWIEYKKEMTQGQTAELRWALEDGSLFLRSAVEGRDTFLMRCDYDPI